MPTSATTHSRKSSAVIVAMVAHAVIALFEMYSIVVLPSYYFPKVKALRVSPAPM